ncbi:hypothetical protein QF035_000242 [Streptomyces umbrinus]|uniref:CBS domain-containing protein n=1 Tax=Streptomyces umbrinus TaxID=67370 RepID=A0ABU0SGG3_9ACTN|nr:hypothetical protein [Streptomyces umbrinus]MDQ1022660.1 hypothetical protein [Streptomyces umbrinus]
MNGAQTAQLMRENDIGNELARDGDQLLGLVTDRSSPCASSPTAPPFGSSMWARCARLIPYASVWRRIRSTL